MIKDEKNINEYRRNLKTKILEEARSKFAVYGVKAVKMDNISQSLGISKRTLYELFPNKEELLYESLRYSMEKRNIETEQKLKDAKNVMDVLLVIIRDNAEYMSRVNPVLFDDIIHYPKVRTFLAQHREANKTKHQEFLKKGINEGYFKTNVNLELLDEITEILRESMIQRRLYFRFQMEDLFYHMVLFFIRGICTEKGVLELDRILT